MLLVLIRHGKAESDARDPAERKPDALRELTGAGKRKMRQAARGLRNVCPKLDLIAVSPLRRAVQTADIVAKAYRNGGAGAERVELVHLSPGSSAALVLAWLREQAPNLVIALVGHEPTLSRCAGLLVTGRDRRMLLMKKGAACVIDLPGAVAAGKGLFRALLQPAVLRAIG